MSVNVLFQPSVYLQRSYRGVKKVPLSDSKRVAVLASVGALPRTLMQLIVWMD